MVYRNDDNRFVYQVNTNEIPVFIDSDSSLAVDPLFIEYIRNPPLPFEHLDVIAHLITDAPGIDITPPERIALQRAREQIEAAICSHILSAIHEAVPFEVEDEGDDDEAEAYAFWRQLSSPLQHLVIAQATTRAANPHEVSLLSMLLATTHHYFLSLDIPARAAWYDEVLPLLKKFILDLQENLPLLLHAVPDSPYLQFHWIEQCLVLLGGLGHPRLAADALPLPEMTQLRNAIVLLVRGLGTDPSQLPDHIKHIVSANNEETPVDVTTTGITPDAHCLLQVSPIQSPVQSPITVQYHQRFAAIATSPPLPPLPPPHCKDARELRRNSPGMSEWC